MKNTVANTYTTGHGNEYAKLTGDGSVYTYVTGYGNDITELKSLGFDNVIDGTDRLKIRVEKLVGIGCDHRLGTTIEKAARRSVKVGDVVYVRPEDFLNLGGFREWASEQIEIIKAESEKAWAEILQEQELIDWDNY